MKSHCWFALLLSFAVASTPFRVSAESFRNPVRIPTDSDPLGIAIVDLNNDGRPDILWGGYGASLTGPGVVHTLLAQASGGYVAGPTLNVPVNVASVCMPADETGDGIIDIVCPSAYQFSASIYTFPGNGDGSFGTPIISAVPTLPSNGAWVAPALHPLADLNGDGIADLILIERHTGSGYTMLGNGHGSFIKSASISGYGVPQVMDVNGDGKADVMFSTGYVWLGKGDGTFTQAAGTLSTGATCVFHDMDGDGKPDAICGLAETNNGDIIGGTEFEILHGNGDGTFNPTPIKSVIFGDHSNEYNGFGTFGSPLTIADLNGDGIPDVLAQSGDGLAVILGHEQLAFDYPAHYATGYLPSSFGEYAMQVADLNGDGLPDVVSTGPNGIYISYARKDGTLDTAPAYEVTQVIGYQTLADFNEDGNPDVAATGDTSIELNLGKSDGTFQGPIALPSGGIDFSTPLSSTNAHILHGDFNGDHHQDIIAIGSSATYQYDNYILFGDGKGSFTTPQLVPNTTDLYPMYESRRVADLNGDGRDDLFSNDYGHLYAWLSNGDGTFLGTTTTIGSIANQSGVSSSAVLADFDGDDKLDAAWVAGANVVLSKGHGDGSFDSSVLSFPIPNSTNTTWSGASITSGDFDGDGQQDIAVLIDFQNSTYYGPVIGVQSAVFVFYGAGDGTFTPGVLAGQFDRVYTGIFSADLNNEGLDDLILKTSGSLGGGYAIGIVDSLPNRTFGSEVNYYAGTGLADISIADLNHDGFADLLFANGDDNLRASSVTVLMNQGNPPVTGSLAVDPEPSQYNEGLALNANFVPSSFTPVTGTATFAVDGNPAGAVTIAGNKASLALNTSMLPGKHVLTVFWPGNSIYSAITFTASHEVEKAPSSVALSSSLTPAPLGSSVIFTATISSALPVGTGADTVMFFDGTIELGTVAVSGENTATYTTSSLALGSHSVTAVYSGNSQVQGSTSSALAETVPYFIGDFSIQAVPATATVTAGQSGTFQVALAASGGFSAPMAFSCSGLPSLATCTFSPSTLSTGQGQVSLRIQTAGSAQTASLNNPVKLPAAGAGAILAGFLFFLLPARERRRRFVSLLCLVLASFAVFPTISCGGGGGGKSGGTQTPPQNYQVTITAATTEPSQNISHSTNVTLKVQ
jgi:hypothetical protein